MSAIQSGFGASPPFSRTQRKTQSARINVAKTFLSPEPCRAFASTLHLLSFSSTKGGEMDLESTWPFEQSSCLYDCYCSPIFFISIFCRLCFIINKTTLHLKVAFALL